MASVMPSVKSKNKPPELMVSFFHSPTHEVITIGNHFRGKIFCQTLISQSGLEISHEQSGRHPFAGNIRNSHSQIFIRQFNKVKIISTHLFSWQSISLYIKSIDLGWFFG